MTGVAPVGFEVPGGCASVATVWQVVLGLSGAVGVFDLVRVGAEVIRYQVVALIGGALLFAEGDYLTRKRVVRLGVRARLFEQSPDIDGLGGALVTDDSGAVGVVGERRRRGRIAVVGVGRAARDTPSSATSAPAFVGENVINTTNRTRNDRTIRRISAAVHEFRHRGSAQLP